MRRLVTSRLIWICTVCKHCLYRARSKRHGHDTIDVTGNGNTRTLLTAPSMTNPIPTLPSVHQSSIEERFNSRRQHLLKECSVQKRYYQVQDSELAVKEHLTIDKNYKVVYCTCAIEKIGCTFWKRVFQIMSGFRNVSDPFDIQSIRAYEGYLTAKGMPFDKIHMILSAYSKFMFVREPFQRLLSGYVDNLFSANAAYWEFVGKYITTNFRKNATMHSRNCGHDVTFEEFVRYFLHSQSSSEKRDAHFVPNFEHCRPCEVDYEYIGKLETFEEDTHFLLKRFKLDNIVQFYDFRKEAEIDAIVEAVDYVFSMKKAILRCMSLQEAMLRAYRKLQTRGIISKDVPFPYSLQSTREISPVEYKQSFLRAHMQSGDAKYRKGNRKEAFLEAYSTIPWETLNKLKEEMSVDTHLFGYEALPKELQELNTGQKWVSKSGFEYFKL